MKIWVKLRIELSFYKGWFVVRVKWGGSNDFYWNSITVFEWFEVSVIFIKVLVCKVVYEVLRIWEKDDEVFEMFDVWRVSKNLMFSFVLGCVCYWNSFVYRGLNFFSFLLIFRNLDLD